MRVGFFLLRQNPLKAFFAQTTGTDSTSSTMVGTRRNPNSRPRTPPPICQHCGTRGHVSDLCSRTHYTSTMPTFSCSNCLKEIVSCNSTDPVRFDVSVRIINCSEHRTTTARPPPPPSPTGPGTATSSSTATSSPTATSSTASTSTSAVAPSPTTTSTAPPPYTSPRADNTPSTVPPQPAPQRAPPTLQRRGTRTRTLLPLQLYTDIYSSVVDTMHQTSCGLYEALDTVSIKRGFWRNTRPIAEALLVDPTRFKETLRNRGSTLNLKRAKMEAAAVLSTASGQQKLRTLHLDGVTLVPLEKY